MSIKNKIKNYFTDEYEYEYEYEEEDNYSENNSSQPENKQNVVSLTSIQQATSKVVLYEPRTYNEAQEIADHLVNRRTVVINLQQVDRALGRRIVDFLSGTVYAIEGEMQKLGAETFLCAPDNVDISGSISDVILEDDFKKGW